MYRWGKRNSPPVLDKLSPVGNTMQSMEILKSWLSVERGRSLRLARHLDVVPSFVNKMASGERPVPTEHGAAIEQFTDRAVTRQAMFPKDWRRIWPELATTPAANDADTAQAAQQGVANA